MDLTELNHEKRSGAVRAAKPDTLIQHTMPCLTNLVNWKSCCLPQMDTMTGTVGKAQHVTSVCAAFIPRRISVDPLKPVHTRDRSDIVTDAGVSSMMALTSGRLFHPR